MKHTVKYIFFIILLYLFLFDPACFMFRGIMRFSNIILCIAAIYVLFDNQILLKYFHTFRKEFILFSALLAFVIFRSALEFETTYINKMLMAYLNIFLVIPFLLTYAMKNGFGSESQIVRALMLTGTFASLITLFCLIDPSIHLFVRDELIQTPDDSYLLRHQYRGFGFSSYLTSNYGFILGFVAGLGLFYLKDNKWFVIFMPLVIVAGLVNCRTTIIIFLAMIVIFLFSTRKIKLFVLIGIYFLLLMTISSIIVNILDLENTMEWIMAFFEEIHEMAESGNVNSSTTGKALFEEMLVFPNSFDQWIFGRGFDIFEGGVGIHNSDMGWLRQLNYGGLFYIILFYSIMLYMVRKMIYYKQINYLFAFIFVFSIVNTKTMAYPGGTFFPLLMLIYYFRVTQRTKLNLKLREK